MHVLICGSGVIGTSTAYFLAARGANVTVVERRGVACAASGKSGGFLALDWCDGTPLEALARRSFDLHAELAGKSDEDWGYRRLTTYSGDAPAHRTHDGVKLAWLSPQIRIRGQLGGPGTTAQVHPEAFTRAMMRAAQSKGATLHIGEVSDVCREGDRIVGVEVGGHKVSGDAVVIAMGPWSILAARWLALPAVYGSKGHSIVLGTGMDVPPEALFLEMDDEAGHRLSPEVFPRPDGTTWVCAYSSEAPLPLDPADVAPDPGAMDRLKALCARISPVLGNAEVVSEQACFRPLTQDGLPLIGAVPGASAAYIAAGHSVWGILNAPATGEAMAELILDGEAKNVDLHAFTPGRLRVLDPARLR